MKTDWVLWLSVVVLFLLLITHHFNFIALDERLRAVEREVGGAVSVQVTSTDYRFRVAVR